MGESQPNAELVSIVVCGLHLRDQPLNHQLTELGAKFFRSGRTRGNYKLFAIPGQDGRPAKPGIVYVTDSSGTAVYVELWKLSVESLGRFVIKVPSPLAIGTVHLEDGSSCLGFLAEGYITSLEGVKDITYLGNWLKYLELPESAT